MKSVEATLWTKKCIAIIAITGVLAPAAWADDKNGDGKEKKPTYIRIARDSRGGPLAMETSIVTLSNGKEGEEKVTVELVSAIHVADKRYYEDLNKVFDGYEALLYELVAAEGATPADRPKKSAGHPIGALQDGLKELLDLEHQLNVVDYEKENFIHADMSPEDFDKAMKNRGESFLSMFFRLAFESMKAQGARGGGGGEDIRLLFAMMSSNRPLALKRIMADQFEQLDTISAGLDGPNGSAIVTDRNGKALDVLKKTLADGKKRIGIFYGAAHMPDMEKRLVNDFGFKRESERWLVAWDMKDEAPKSEFLDQLNKNRAKKKKAAKS